MKKCLFFNTISWPTCLFSNPIVWCHHWQLPSGTGHTHSGGETRTLNPTITTAINCIIWHKLNAHSPLTVGDSEVAVYGYLCEYVHSSLHSCQTPLWLCWSLQPVLCLLVMSGNNASKLTLVFYEILSKIDLSQIFNLNIHAHYLN